MLKKFLLASAVLTATSTGVAVASPAPYVGASLGIVNNYNDKANFNGQNLTLSTSTRGAPFSVFAGYGGVLDQNFYLAGEVFGTVGTASISDNKFLRTSYGYGASILPGVMLSDHTLAFARVGVVKSHFSDSSLNTNATGGQFGLGLQTSLTQNVSLRGEYDFTAYRKISDSDIYGNSASIHPRSDAFNVGLVYSFD